MTNERARARALCMNEYDRNIVSLLSKLFTQVQYYVALVSYYYCEERRVRKKRAAYEKSTGRDMSTIRLDNT